MTENSTNRVEIEDDLLADVSVDLGWQLIERFSTLVRESGSDEESAAADYIVGELKRLGVDHEVFEPELYLSLPRESSVVLPGSEGGGGGGGDSIRAKPPSFAVPTANGGLTASAVYVPAADMKDIADIFADLRDANVEGVRGKIVVSDGYAMPLPVQRFARAGAVGQSYVNPGENIHWGICTPIWGTPTDSNLEGRPNTPVVAINQADGRRLIDALAAGPADVTIHAALDEGWYRCKLPVATIDAGSDDFMLVHGHYDSWDVGIGDNAVGDATLLELARIFSAQRSKLKRSLKIAWWPAHSTGRYGGSTWYADQFAVQLRKHCVATINIDSPGCWNATAYEEVMWMAEADDLCRAAIVDGAGVEPGRRRPVRAGDYSFNQLGITSFFMLLSNIPKEMRDELGFYPVGGCGGNIAWHTEDDQLAVADREVLERDLRVYVTAIARVLNTEILPFDYRETVREIAQAVKGYRDAAAGQVDLSSIGDELENLTSALDDFYTAARSNGGEISAAEANDIQKELARILVPLNYSAGESFSHDPALPLRAVPRLSAIAKLDGYRDSKPERLPFLQTGIRRQVNKVANSLYLAARIARRHA